MTIMNIRIKKLKSQSSLHVSRKKGVFVMGNICKYQMIYSPCYDGLYTKMHKKYNFGSSRTASMFWNF